MSEFNIEEFKELMQEMNNASVGTIGLCTARYGGERDSAMLEEFISAITTFKLTENISDSEVINGMPMLLWGEAAEWWSGVKDTIGNFESLVQKIRGAFSPLKPAWRIYADIFENKQQKSEPTESFIRKKRALFAKLTKPPAESDQIDIIFGFLHTQIRDLVFRHRVVNFDELVKHAREAEDTLHERASENSSTSGSTRCSYCRLKGHTVDKCYKREKLEAEAKQAALVSVNRTGTKPTLACYGCNEPGFSRSNCPKCKVVSANPVGSDIPLVNVKIFGVLGQAHMDTGARLSVASANLKKILDFYDCNFSEIHAETVLADGSKSVQTILSTSCKIEVGGKKLDIKFVVLPNTSPNRILLGSDFLEHAGIVLNMSQRYWYFEAHPSVHFDFAKPVPIEMNLLETVGVTNKSLNSESISASRESTKRKASEEMLNNPKQLQR